MIRGSGKIGAFVPNETILVKEVRIMRSDWVKRLGEARGWVLGAAVVVAGLFCLLRR